MAVVVSCATAVALIAEGAVCLNADTEVVTHEGNTISIESMDARCTGPILVCGSPSAVAVAADALEADGLPIWRVAEIDGHTGCCRIADGSDSS